MLPQLNRDTIVTLGMHANAGAASGTRNTSQLALVALKYVPMCARAPAPCSEKGRPHREIAPFGNLSMTHMVAKQSVHTYLAGVGRRSYSSFSDDRASHCTLKPVTPQEPLMESSITPCLKWSVGREHQPIECSCH